MRIPAQVVGKLDWQDHQLAGCSVGPKDTLHLLLASRQNRHHWRALCFSGMRDWEHRIEGDHAYFDFVQPLPEGFLFARARQSRGAPNGCVFDLDGRLLRQLSLGDGIASLQTTTSGAIWASYFDEGVFGESVASAGLVRFGGDGTPEYEFQPSGELDRISDCYALNVESEDAVWFYYYTPFLLVRLRKDEIDGVWQPNLAGAAAFAVRDDRVVMHAGYHQNDWRLLQLREKGMVKSLGHLYFVDESGDSLPVSSAFARGSLIWFVQNSTVYRVDISHL